MLNFIASPCLKRFVNWFWFNCKTLAPWPDENHLVVVFNHGPFCWEHVYVSSAFIFSNPSCQSCVPSVLHSLSPMFSQINVLNSYWPQGWPNNKCNWNIILFTFMCACLCACVCACVCVAYVCAHVHVCICACVHSITVSLTELTVKFICTCLGNMELRKHRAEGTLDWGNIRIQIWLRGTSVDALYVHLSSFFYIL